MRGLVALAFVAAASFATSGIAAAPALFENDRGFEGILTEDGVVVEFEAVDDERAGVVHAETRNGAGEVMIEVDIDYRNGDFVTRVLGIVLTGSNTEDEIARMKRALAVPEADLVRRELVPVLARADSKRPARPLAAMRSLLVVHEGMAPDAPADDDDDECFGCCGPGCWGCTGCYTTACAAHDACVRVHGQAHNTCQQLLVYAAISAWCCQGVNMGPLC